MMSTQSDNSREPAIANSNNIQDGRYVTNAMSLSPVSAMHGHYDPNIPQILPHDKMYKIQVGQQLFRISGASLSSDGPSFFTNYFIKVEASRNTSGGKSDTKDTSDGNQGTQGKSSHDSRANDKTSEVLFIDRSADVFQLIYQHLQGYFPEIKDEVIYTRLFADAIYYDLPRLRTLLKNMDYYYTNISGKTFKLSKSLFRRKGDSPNYFEMTMATLYIDVEELIVSKRLLRPPPHSAPYVARSPEFFQDLITLLGGGTIELDDKKRESLIKECKYYRFANLEQRLIKADISYNPIIRCEEICLSLKDLSKKGIVLPSLANSNFLFDDIYLFDTDPTTQFELPPRDEPPLKRVKLLSSNLHTVWNIIEYKRPYLDDYSRQLMFQIEANEALLILNKESKTIHLDLTKDTAKKFENIFSKLILEETQGNVDLSKYKFQIPSLDERSTTDHIVLPALLSMCDLNVNGVPCRSLDILLENDNIMNKTVLDVTNIDRPDFNPNEPKHVNGLKIYLAKSIWKIAIKNGGVILIAMKARAFTGNKEYNKFMNFL